MTNSYSLRFENGERRGETVPFAGSRFTIGRRPGNSLQILEGSVSGNHAELVVDDKGILLRDLGSTNGTRVGSDRILEMRVAPGAVITFGSVRLSLHAGMAPGDSGATITGGTPELELEETVIAAVPQAFGESGPQADASQELMVSAENLARASKGSKLGLLVLVVIGAVGGGLWWFLGREGSGGSDRLRAVVPVQGNLLAEGYSFEDETSPWVSREGAPAAFIVDARARFSGSQGLVADLAEGEWALSASQDVRATKGLVATAELRTTGDAVAQLGIQFAKSGEGADYPAPVTAWSGPLADAAVFETVELAAPVPAGYDRASVVVRAGAPAGGEGGSVHADDVRLVTGGSAGPTVTIDEYRFYALGEPACTGVLFKVDRVLFSGLEVRPSVTGPIRNRAPLVSSAVENGIRCKAMGRPGGVLALRAEAAAARNGLATIGEGGFRQHSVEFEREGVTDVLIGGGLDLVRLLFDEPVKLKGRSDGSAFRLQIELGGLSEWLVQLKFREERAAAATLAADATDAERQGELGDCLRLWQSLLDEYPFEQQYVARAEETRGRLIRQGLDEVRVVSQEVERARFFRLVDLFRQCRQSVDDVAAKYAGSEVETGARALGEEIDRDLLSLEAELDRHEVGRLRSILSALEAQGAGGLASEVRSYLSDHFEAR